jgi:hypothetical protein
MSHGNAVHTIHSFHSSVIYLININIIEPACSYFKKYGLFPRERQTESSAHYGQAAFENVFHSRRMNLYCFSIVQNIFYTEYITPLFCRKSGMPVF